MQNGRCCAQADGKEQENMSYVLEMELEVLNIRYKKRNEMSVVRKEQCCENDSKSVPTPCTKVKPGMGKVELWQGLKSQGLEDESDSSGLEITSVSQRKMDDMKQNLQQEVKNKKQIKVTQDHKTSTRNRLLKK
jgi:hypothetical protein